MILFKTELILAKMLFYKQFYGFKNPSGSKSDADTGRTMCTGKRNVIYRNNTYFRVEIPVETYGLCLHTKDIKFLGLFWSTICDSTTDDEKIQ